MRSPDSCARSDGNLDLGSVVASALTDNVHPSATDPFVDLIEVRMEADGFRWSLAFLYHLRVAVSSAGSKIPS